MEIETLDRRAILALGGALLAAGAAMPSLAEDKALPTEARGLPPDAPKAAMLVYPKMVPLDLIGPLTIFNLARFDVRLVWKDKTPVVTSNGLSIAATETFDECPADLDVLFVPGGIAGTVACMNDPMVLGFLADRGARAKWVTGVCTGTLVLAAAGLLKGYDATSHWAVADMLPLMGARHVDHRVVRDRNRMTGGGVTAGIDFGLTLVAEIKGEEVARTAQLTVEYAPAPPFANGTPAEAGPERAAAMRRSRKPIDDQARAAAERIGKTLDVPG